jgi:hypothetical protein
MLKVSLRYFILSAGLFLVPIHNASAMFSTCYVDSGFKSVSAKDMRNRVNRQGMNICYEAAFCLAQAEGNLQPQQIDFLRSRMSIRSGSSNNYSEEYRSMMGHPSSLEGLKTELVSGPSVGPETLSLSDIKESGFINFQRMHGDENIFHTAYIQVTKGGKKIIYNANHVVLTHKLLLASGASKISSVGVTPYFVLEVNGQEGKALSGFNEFISDERQAGQEIGFHFTPVTTLSAQIASRISEI